MRKTVRNALLYSLPLFVGTAVNNLQASEPPRPPPTLPGSVPLNPIRGQLDTNAPSDDMSAPANYDEVVHDLIEQLLNKRAPVKAKEVLRTKRKKEDLDRDAAGEKEQFTVNAQDAARKLASLGKRAVPDLTILFKANYDHKGQDAGAERAAQIAYYTAWALARIRTVEASRALMPLMNNPSAPPDLRLIAVDAAGWEKSDEGFALLEKAATTDPDLEIRKHALAQLAMIPEFWQRAEPIFVAALSNPNEDVRIQATKACHFAHIFMTATPKLIELMEKDPSPMVRLYALLTIARTKSQKAEPALIRVLQQPDLDEKLRKQALTAITIISGIPFRKPDDVVAWWTRTGKQEYENFARNDKLTDERLAEMNAGHPIKAAPKVISKDGETQTDGATLPSAADGPTADIVPLDGAAVKPAASADPATKSATESSDSAPAPAITATRADPAPETLNSNESSGSQRRRLRK